MPFKFDEIPVSSRLDETVKASLDQIKKEKRRNFKRKLLFSSTSEAAAFAAAVIVCVSNPALAAKLPIVGSLFAGMEDDFPYAGDYSDRAQVLTPPETSVAEETPGETEPDGETTAGQEDASTGETAMPANSPYSVTDNGVTFTASEIYSDGLSVFLSLQIHSEESFGFDYETQTPLTATLYPDGQAYIDSEEVTFASTELFVQQLDEHNFNGMIKTDLPVSLLGADGTHLMRISLKRFMADIMDENGTTISNPENIMDTSIQIDGSWELELPFQTDLSQLQSYEDLSDTTSPGRITDVYVSPYQVAVNFVSFDDGFGNPEGGIVCFDENGTLLEKGNQSTEFGTDAFSLNKCQPAELRLYVIEDWITSCKIRDEETAKEQAVSSLVLPLSW